jgi:HlyD family secretion protein
VTALNLDDELSIQESGWRGLAITFGVILIVAAFAIAAAYYFFFRDEATTVRATEDYTVVKGTINSNLLISGTADARLNSDLTFQTSGKVASVAVKVGDVVKQGQILASLESEDLANAVASAQANQRTAQLKLDDLVDGSTAAELAAAEQAVASAQSALTKAQNDYEDLADGASSSDVATAQQAVDLARSQVATATSTLNKLEDTPSDADLAAAEASVALAESTLANAETTADNAANSTASARSTLYSKQDAHCASSPVPVPSFCPTNAAPVSGADLAILNADLSTTALDVIEANKNYENAANTETSADAAVASAQDALDSAEAKLAAVEDGPSNEEMDAARAAVLSAQAALTAAEAKLADVNDGADPLVLSSAQSAVQSAEAGLASAEAKLDEARRGPDQNTLEQARQAVRTAQLTVEAAQIRLKNAQLIAPFDGTIASVNIAPGEFASAAAQVPPMVMLTPDLMILTLDIEETDYPNVKLGQGGVALFDGIPGGFYPFSISEIGLSPTTTQGVITYEAKAVLTIPPNGPRPAPGMNANGQLTTSSKADIVVVPPRALRRRGSEQIVDVRRDGTVVEQVVTTGVSDNSNVEVVTGLAEGDVVVLPAVAGAGPGGGGPTPVPTIPGGIR